MMKIALGQFKVGKTWQENLQKIETLMTQASVQGAALLTLPESVLARDITDPDIVLKSAQSLDGPFMRGVLSKSRALDLSVSLTIMTKTDGPRVHNDHIIVQAGTIRAVYTKLHLYDAFKHQESKKVAPGQALPEIVEIAGFKLGLMTCYDLRFPELARYLALAGADVILVPAAWVRGLGKEAHWTVLNTARAIENTCYVVATGECGERNIGASMVVDPLGVPIVQAGEAETLVCAELSKARIEHARMLLPALKNCRFQAPQLA